VTGPATHAEHAAAAIESAERNLARAAELRAAGNLEHAADYEAAAARAMTRHGMYTFMVDFPGEEF
jgi:hypothetical protein